MRLKHNKKRNTAFVYEALVRELTKSVIKNNKNKQNKIVSIIKEHFTSGTLLKEELELYKSIYETKDIDKRLAEKIIIEVKEKYLGMPKKQLFLEQSKLINSINRKLSNKVFNNFVPNYKNIASVYSIFQDALPVKDRVLLEENLLNHMSASATDPDQTEKRPIDNIVYKTFVESFNKQYSESLTAKQKIILSKYISSFADNGLELKAALNEEIGDLKQKLSKYMTDSEFSEDAIIREKLEKVYSLLDETKEKQIDEDVLEIVLKTQNLVKEIEEDGDNT